MPILYSGGKAKLAKRIVAVCDAQRASGEAFWDLCCGSGRVVGAAADRGPRYGVDVVPSLIALLCGVRDGTFVPPAELTEDQYDVLKTRAQADPLCGDPLLAFAGFGVSYMGQWFSSYARDVPSHKQWFVGAATRNCAKHVARFAGTEFICAPWQSLVDRISGTVYIDPPYAGTLGFPAAPSHDPKAFWKSADELHERDAVRQIFVSEYAAPAHWQECARWEVWKRLNMSTKVERLFTRA